jgi:hypothetical protein
MQVAWRELLGHFEQAFVHGSPRVASAAVTSMKELLFAHAAELPPHMCDAFTAAAHADVC